MQLDFFRRLIAPPEKTTRDLAPVPEPEPPRVEPTVIRRSTVPLEIQARTILQRLGCTKLAEEVRVRWNPKMRSTAGTAYPAKGLITLNPKLIPFGDAEIERTMLHELAHLLAHHRAGRRRIAAHGPQWRAACREVGLPNETRCHDLPLPRRHLERKHTYRCPACAKLMHRVEPLRRKAACLSCCRAHAGGRFDERFAFVKVRAK